MKHAAGLIYGPDAHHLDHLAPLCSLFEIPLIITEPLIAALARQFYPDLEVLHWSSCETPEKMVSTFEIIFYSIPRVLFDQIFFFSQTFHRKWIKTIWCPHGNSDKGRNSPFMEALKDEELLLTYGPRMEHFLMEKGVQVPTYRIGNYRFFYYEKHKIFYDSLLPKKKTTTLLYAPTWQDGEKNSSFPKIWPLLCQTPQRFSLTVKLHPHLYSQFPHEIEEFKRQIPKHVSILENFPPIYPLLSQTDLYIGDMSSMGYDFLAFNRPMILLNPSPLSGTYIKEEEYESLFEICDSALQKTDINNSLYEETFGKVNYKKRFSLDSLLI